MGSLQGGGQASLESQGSDLTAELARVMFPVLLEIYSASAGRVNLVLVVERLMFQPDVKVLECDRQS